MRIVFVRIVRAARSACVVGAAAVALLGAEVLCGAGARASTVEIAVPTAARPTAGVATGCSPFVPNVEERALFDLVNQERARAHLPALVWDGALARVARDHSADMSGRARLDHRSSSTGRTPIERAQRAGLHPGLLLENIGYAYSAEQANFALMYSAGHRNNILHPDVRKLGVGVVVRIEPDGDRQLWVTQDFARDLPKADAATAARSLAAVVAAYRGRAVTPDGDLAEMAQAAAEIVAAGNASLEMPVLVGRSGLGTTKRPFSLQVITVRTADPEHLGALPAAADRIATTYGVGVALEPDDGRPVRNACVVLILGGP